MSQHLYIRIIFLQHISYTYMYIQYYHVYIMHEIAMLSISCDGVEYLLLLSTWWRHTSPYGGSPGAERASHAWTGGCTWQSPSPGSDYTHNYFNQQHSAIIRDTGGDWNIWNMRWMRKMRLKYFLSNLDFSRDTKTGSREACIQKN